VSRKLVSQGLDCSYSNTPPQSKPCSIHSLIFALKTSFEENLNYFYNKIHDTYTCLTLMTSTFSTLKLIMWTTTVGLVVHRLNEEFDHWPRYSLTYLSPPTAI